MSKSLRKAAPVRATSKGSALSSALTLAFFPKESRPSAGGSDSLRGFTLAWMTLAGLFAGATMSRKDMQALAGKSAVSYHLGNGNFRVTENGEIGLTADGVAHFSQRGMNDSIMAIASGWRVIMATGKADGALVKNPATLRPIAELHVTK